MQANGKYIEWKPFDPAFESENVGTDCEWDVVDAVRRRTTSTSSKHFIYFIFTYFDESIFKIIIAIAVRFTVYKFLSSIKFVITYRIVRTEQLST